MDVGTESYTEKEKGQASDSFKRACVSLVIGRELYTAPFIWVGASKVRLDQKGNRWVCYDKFTVTEIAYSDSREITGLVIVNQDGLEVYRLRDKSGGRASVKDAVNRKTENGSDVNPGRMEPADGRKNLPDKIQAVNRELERTGIALDMVLNRYGVTSIEETLILPIP